MTPREPLHLPRTRAMAAAALAALLTVSLASCAPETDDIAGAKTKDQLASGEASEDQGQRAEIPDEASQKKTELPESFPTDRFELPRGAVIDDAGERSAGDWFVVLRAKDASTAATQWTEVIETGGFEVSDQQGDVERDASATLQGSGLDVFALMLPQDDSSVLLSYDITSSGS
ncbi:hypothetical protein Leucomu_07990 [Leucobacter muris]|uniref:DM13 domain-containing protein n=1 Tax=Leucobacter muris TaxID=1935379 RepID=A0ABX5QFR3_9MICO|nr:hypothetical protein [Leucobacter muris]QAB17861.1 hypothetical protein Leucomu_07990 [Leucobacter muris]